MIGQTNESRVRQVKVADVVADALRTQIVTGVLKDGDLLPKQEILMRELGASREALRQALQILEGEGLVRIRRGNIGGAEVRRPSADNVAYMIALVLESDGTTLEDIAQTLLLLEPECAALCASRPDREHTVIPFIREAQEEVRAAVDDVLAYAIAARVFHNGLVVHSGSQPLSTITRALESIFATHEAVYIDRARAGSALPGIEHRLHSIRLHDRIIDYIADGEAGKARSLARRHLAEGQDHAVRSIGLETIRVSTLRGWEFRR